MSLAMPRAYGTDLRWRAIWMTQFLGLKTKEVAVYLSVSSRTIERLVAKFNDRGRVAPERIGRPSCSLMYHPEIEFIIMEEVLKRPEKTLSEIGYDIYQATGAQCSLSGIFHYLRRNNFSRKKVCHIV